MGATWKQLKSVAPKCLSSLPNCAMSSLVSSHIKWPMRKDCSYWFSLQAACYGGLSTVFDGHDDDGRPKRIEKKLGLGTYPEVSLKEARERRDEHRKLLANGIDPAEQKQRDKRAAMVAAANTFSLVAKAYIAKNKRDGLADATVLKREWFTRLSRNHSDIALSPKFNPTKFWMRSGLSRHQRTMRRRTEHCSSLAKSSVTRSPISSRHLIRQEICVALWPNANKSTTRQS